MKDFQIPFFFGGKKKKNKKKKAFFSAQNNPFNLSKMLISGLVEEKQTKWKARVLTTVRRNIPLFSPSQGWKDSLGCG